VGILGRVDQPAAIDAQSGRVYDAELIDTYIHHLHMRIASLNDQLHDAQERTRRAEAHANGRFVDALQPESTTTYQAMIGRATETFDETEPELVPGAATSLHDEFWYRDSSHLEMLEGDTFLGDLRDAAGPQAPTPKRRRLFVRP
jgi:hypothetical protein